MRPSRTGRAPQSGPLALCTRAGCAAARRLRLATFSPQLAGRYLPFPACAPLKLSALVTCDTVVPSETEGG